MKNSDRSVTQRFMDKCLPVTESGCWIWDATPGSVYGLFWLNGRNEHAHRASWILHNGPIPNGKWVLHTCDVKGCVNPNHLYLGDHKQNTKDAVDRCRMSSGDAHRKARNYEYLKFDQVGTGILSKQDCLSIAERSAFEAKTELAKEYRVHLSTIYRAIYRANTLLNQLQATEEEG